MKKLFLAFIKSLVLFSITAVTIVVIIALGLFTPTKYFDYKIS